MSSMNQAAAGINQMEQLAMKDSPIHRLHPMVKLIGTIAYIVMVISFPSWNISGLLPFLFYPVILMSLSDTPYAPLLKRIIIALPFSLMGGISNLIFMRSTAFYIGTIAISQGIVSFTSIIMKTLFCVLAVLVLIATTSFVEISGQLSALRFPKILCLQLVMIYRYLSILISEGLSMFTAYHLRAPGQKGINIRDMGSFLGQLILRSFDRAECIYAAMKCRGFEGVYKGVYNGRGNHRFTYTEGIILLFLIFTMIALRFYNLSLLLGSLV